MPNRKDISLGPSLAKLLRSVSRDVYHPERHYMRGPGPKWHEKHDPPAGQDTPEPAALVSAKVRA